MCYCTQRQGGQHDYWVRIHLLEMSIHFLTILFKSLGLYWHAAQVLPFLVAIRVLLIMKATLAMVHWGLGSVEYRICIFSHRLFGVSLQLLRLGAFPGELGLRFCGH